MVSIVLGSDFKAWLWRVSGGVLVSVVLGRDFKAWLR